MGEGYIELTEGSGKKVSAQSMTIGGETVYEERAIEGIGVVTLAGTPQISAQGAVGTYPVTAVNCEGRFYLVLKNTFSNTSAIATIRFAFYDSASVLIGYSESINITNLGLDAGGGRYFGDNIVYSNDFCADSIKILIESITSSQNVSITIGVA